MEQMHEISFEQIEDGSIRLEQQSGHGEHDVILLHPEQLKFITRRMCGMNSATAAKVENLERKISILANGLEEFVCETSLRGEILERCECGLEILARLDGLLNLAWEFDGSRLDPKDMRRPQEADVSNSIFTPPIRSPSSTSNAAKDAHSQQLGLCV